MFDIDALTLSYMRNELTKVAVLGALTSGAARRGIATATRGLARVGARASMPDVGRAAATGNVMGSAALAGAGGVVGGVGGGAYGAYEGAQEGGLSGALSGAMNRGYQGAVGGAITGGAAGLLGVGKAGNGAVLRSVTEGNHLLAGAGRMGQRQLHSVTGMVPGGARSGTKEYVDALKGMRVHGFDASSKAREAGKAYESALSTGGSSPRQLQRLADVARKLERNADTAEGALQKGVTSVPGLAREMWGQKSLKPLWEYGVKPQAVQQGMMGKAMLALPAAMALPELAVAEDEQGRGRTERFSKALGEGTAYAATPFIPAVGSDALARGAGAGVGLAGRGIDRLIGAVSGMKKPDIGSGPGAIPPTDGDAQGGIPVERLMSNAAQGKPPEDLMV